MLKILERVGELRMARRDGALLEWEQAVDFLADLPDDDKPSPKRVAELDELLQRLDRSAEELEQAVLTKRKRRELAARLGDKAAVDAEIRRHEAAMAELEEEQRIFMTRVRQQAREHYDAANALRLQAGNFAAVERELIATAPDHLKVRRQEVEIELANLRQRMAEPTERRDRYAALVDQLRERLGRAETDPEKKYRPRDGDQGDGLNGEILPTKADKIRARLEQHERDLRGVLNVLEPLEARRDELAAERAELMAAVLLP